MIELLVTGYIIYMLVALIGITMGYHRYFSHREFKTNAVGETVMLYLGLLCGVRSPLSWAGVHRMHHAHSDTDKDPHSPIVMGRWRVFFSAYHVNTIPRKYIKDLLRNPRVMFFHNYRWHVYVCHLILITSLHFALFCDEYVITEWLTCLTFQLQLHAIIFVLSYIGYGTLNAFGHNHQGPSNRWWINLIAPLEGNHDDHHKASVR